MRNTVAIFHSASDFVDKWMRYIVFVLISTMIIVTTLQVICRVFFTALSWSEEATRYLLVWSTFFTATLAYKRGKHIAITFVVELFPRKIKNIIILLGYLLSVIFFVVVLYYGLEMIKLQVFQISPAMSIPMKHVYLAIPISMAIMVLHAISCAFDKIQGDSRKEDMI